VKKLPPLLLAALLCFLLAACGTRTNPEEPFTPSLAEHLLASGAFSEELAPLEPDILWLVYRLEAAGLSRDSLTTCIGYHSTGATCEQVSVLLFADESSARTAESALQAYLNAQIQSNRNYRPADIPKLEQAVLYRRSTSLLLLVANHYPAATPLIP